MGTMQWTDRIRQVKIILVVAAIVIAVVSLLASHYLVMDLQQEERNKMETWAEAMRALNNDDENTYMSLVLNVIQSNNTIPVIVMDADGTVTDCRNLEMSAREREDSADYVKRYAQSMFKRGNYIKIRLGGPQGYSLQSEADKDYQLVCYDESTLLKRLSQYPYWQLGIVLIFVVVAIFALLASKKAEQNKVWVGLSKETAHQLGTPISSLMAWVEVLKENYPEDEMIPEMDKDVKRLQRIAERFSKIGSLPEPTPGNLNEVIAAVVQYISRRTSNRVVMSCELPQQPLIVRISAPLFEWVIENLCKNAIDAMDGVGKITIKAFETSTCFAVEVSDTGKGIPKTHFGSVFMPGFTTKKRGWGLGLSLAKRIVEEYHQGRIFVKNSEIGRGTTFRIELKKH